MPVPETETIVELLWDEAAPIVVHDAARSRTMAEKAVIMIVFIDLFIKHSIIF